MKTRIFLFFFSFLFVFFLHIFDSWAFTGPPVGCTPATCTNGPLANLLPENIKSGVKIAGVSGSLNCPTCPILNPANIRHGVVYGDVTGTYAPTVFPAGREARCANAANQASCTVYTDYTDISMPKWNGQDICWDGHENFIRLLYNCRSVSWAGTAGANMSYGNCVRMYDATGELSTLSKWRIQGTRCYH
jgi:hypothetical protein